jgi:glutamate-1-semialdehyde 2,1-aminomutase
VVGIPFEQPVHAPRSKQMFERAQHILALGASSNLRRNLTGFPLYFERAEGVYFQDVEGNRYLDYTLGFGPNILGSAHPAINAAIREQLDRAYTFGASHALEFEAAELIAACVPGVEHVILSNTGSEAVQAALRLARASTGRDKVLVFDGHYHGWLNNVRIRRHPRPSYAGEPISLFRDQPASEISEMLVVEWNDAAALEEIFTLYGPKLAAVICEPVPTSGSCMPQPGFLQRIVELCAHHGAFSIFDEVVTGFRIALGGARERFRIEPTLSVYGKAIGGGLPVAAVAGRRAAFDALWDGRTSHAGTYNGNPIGLAATKATLLELMKPGVYAQMESHGDAIRAHIAEQARRIGIQLVTSGTGPSFCVCMGLQQPPRNDREARQANFDQYNWFKSEMLRRRVYLGPEGRWFVSAVHGDAELALVRNAIAESLAVIGDSRYEAPAPLAARRL